MKKISGKAKNNTYKSKPSLVQKAACFITCAFTLFLLLLWVFGDISSIHPLIILLLISLNLYFAYPLIFLYKYSFSDTALHIQEGPLFKTVIPYDDITDFKQVGYFMNKKTKASDTIMIKYKYKKGHTMIEVLPGRKDDFLHDLKQRVHL